MIQFFNKKMSKKRKGFTLIELIVVVAILGILAAIAIPRFTGMRESSNLGAIQSNLRNIQSAAQIVATEANVAVEDIADDSGTGDVFTALGMWPTGPGTVTYSVTNGVATATMGETPPPLPSEYTATTITLDDIATGSN